MEILSLSTFGNNAVYMANSFGINMKTKHIKHALFNGTEVKSYKIELNKINILKTYMFYKNEKKIGKTIFRKVFVFISSQSIRIIIK